ncbi:hypothetical protein [Pseudomonas chlororaphis]|uniref:hypothetical protein n=1 Tax=Pseudomonas chlororaphis TaxID=587753 RepID=UPI002365B642|nr:hypothetical protein [Pseudomonas chlororaphis]WDH22893.1 hypothetical protein PUP50_00985 [Pseudomonas chlororaphis]
MSNRFSSPAVGLCAKRIDVKNMLQRFVDTYLKDVLMSLPTQRASEIGQLLPHQWMPA